MADSNNSPKKDKRTDYLVDRTPAEPMPLQRMTGALVEPLLPWVIEFRVVGTAEIIKIRTRSAMLIGRLDESRGIFPDIDVTDYDGQSAGVSRRHAMLITRDNRVTIQDLGSANGTYINGRVLEAHESYRVRDRDRLRLGRLELQVHFVVKPLVDENTMVNMKNVFKVPQIGHREHILIADENEDVCRVVRFIAEKAGFRVTEAFTVTDAMHAIDNDPPEIAFLELVMGDDSGVDLIRYLRNHHRLSTRQLIAAADAPEEQIEKSSPISSDTSDDSSRQQTVGQPAPKHVAPFYDKTSLSSQSYAHMPSPAATQELVAITSPHRVQPNIPIAIMSSVTGGYQMGKALEAGADVTLAKPVAVDELVGALQETYEMLTGTS
ncbi:FHA domain-containing protein [Phototrophicus methaneseepsis]|uniref:FHA domain-containing protein n=1 Tax=Phototrophicus methaneseepsis TaxID=2710758 RepID=A0A7S8IFJ4_9CHLR|nr:FHA domain-containing protein [Phototrophicus methaneseepsis]QPC84795.1 FHA domain-containing protein [Phototrophicus methaneseepsis]